MRSLSRLNILLMDFGVSSAFWLIFASFMTYVYEATHSIFLLSILILIKNIVLAIILLLLNYVNVRLYFRKLMNIAYLVLVFIILFMIFYNSIESIILIFILFIVFETVFMIHNILKYNAVIFIDDKKVEFINLMYELSYSIFMILGSIYAILLLKISLPTYVLTLALIILSFFFFNRIKLDNNIQFDGSSAIYENSFRKLLILLLLADFLVAAGENIAYILLPPIANFYVYNSKEGYSISLLIFGLGSLMASVLLLSKPGLILRNYFWIFVFVVYSLFPASMILSIILEEHAKVIFTIGNTLAGFANSYLMLFFTSLYQRIGKEEFKKIYGIAYLLISIAASISTLTVGFAYESLGIYNTLFLSTALLAFTIPLMIFLNNHYRRLVIENMKYEEISYYGFSS
jgi:hypothetical protein